MRGKTLLVIFGLMVLIVSGAGLAISLGFTPGFLAALPTNVTIFFGINVILGLLAIIYGSSHSTW